MKSFSGPSDAGIEYPEQEGSMGQKDPTAMAEFKKALAQTLIVSPILVKLDGTIASPTSDRREEYPASLTAGSGNRFRLDIQKADGMRTLRIDGENGKVKRSTGELQQLEDIDFVHPFEIPLSMPELMGRDDAAVIDDGIVMIDKDELHKVTITLFKTRYRDPVSASFYFDDATHMLRKGAFLEHSSGNRSLHSLVVVTYADYRKEQSIVVPHDYVETVNGRLFMSFKVSGVSLLPSVEKSYFSF